MTAYHRLFDKVLTRTDAEKAHRAAFRAIRAAQPVTRLVGGRVSRAVVNATFDPVAKAAADAASEDVQAWETLMWTFQQALPFAQPGEKWLPMERIYSLAKQN